MNHISILYDPMKDIESALEPLTAQIADVEENVKSIVQRNENLDEEIQGMKTDIISLSDKILAIKVRSFQLFKTHILYVTYHM